jgi:hypothetical protein
MRDWRGDDGNEWMDIWLAITGVTLAWAIVGCMVMLTELL